MKLHEKSLSNRGKPIMLAAAAAAGILLSPLLERTAHAQDPPHQEQVQQRPQPRAPTETRREFDGMVRQGSEILSLINSERVLGSAVSPYNMAELRVSSVDQNGVEFSFMMNPTGPASTSPAATFRVNFDGTKSGHSEVLTILGLQNVAVASAPDNQASISFTYVDSMPPGAERATRTLSMRGEPPREEHQVVRHPGRHYSDYTDLALHPFSDQVDVSGRRRDLSLNHDWDIGGHVYSNEAGAAVWATARYAPSGQNTLTPLDLRLSGGNMWFGEQPAPFARLFVRPGIDFWRMRAVYYGSVATVGNLPSWLYTSHSLGLGYSQPLGDGIRLRLGIVAGGAVSFPAYDNIEFSMATGASLQVRNWLVYAMPNFYLAAPDPIKVAYVGYYRPEFQNVQFGVQTRFLDDMYTARLFGDVSTLYQRFGGRLTRTFNVSNDVAVDVWGGLGATHWIQTLGGRWDPVVFAGINVVLGGRYINSTNTIRYEHLQSGGVRFARTDIPTQSDPGPYGFGRTGNGQVDAQVNDAKSRFLSSDSLATFSSSYSTASYDDKIMTARFIGAFAQQAAYASGAWDSLNNTRFFDPEVQRIASQSPETIYQFMRRLVDFYNTHSPGTPLPSELANGIAMCGGVAFVQSAYLNANGIPTIVASVNTRNGPHMVPIAMPPSGTVLLDYGRAYTTDPGTFDQAMRFYSQNRGAPIFQSQLFSGSDAHYLGTYITSEGRILTNATGLNNMVLLGSDFLGLGPGGPGP